MKILFVAHNFVRGNGQGRIQYEIVRHALQWGNEVTLVADSLAPEMVEAGAVWHHVRQRPQRPNIVGARVFAATADRHVRRLAGSHDVVVGAGYTLGERCDVSLCQFVHGAWLESPVHVAKLCRGPYSWYQSLYTQANARWERLAYANAGVVVAPSVKIRDELIGIGLPPAAVRVIYNGVDLNEFKPADSDVRRDALGVPVGVPLALFVGDIRTPRKNLDTVLRALATTDGLHLAVAGALDRSPFPALAAELGITDRVHFLDYRRDVDRLMRACDLFVFPSRYEAGTLVLLEAAASGLPIVTARTAGGCEVLGSVAAVILEDPNDAAALAAALRKFVADPDARASASRAARETAERYSWSDMAGQYLELMGERVARRADVAAPISFSNH
jgi:glycosyltransferase involved in cell wall biosynthesis